MSADLESDHVVTPAGGSDQLAWIASVIVMGLAAALAARTIWLLDRGFDFTDQSAYLLIAQRPADYDLAFGLWGYGLHPLYLLAGGSIPVIERAGALVLIVLGAALGIITANNLDMDWRRPVTAQMVAVAASLPLSYYSLWLPVPSYNWIALVGGIGLMIAVVLLAGTVNKPLCSAASAASAIVLAVFARPQNAAGYGLLYLAAVCLAIPTNGGRLKQIFRATCCAIIAVGIVVAVSPVGTIVNQIKAYYAIFGTEHPFHFSFADQQVAFLKSGWLWGASGIVFAFALFVRRNGRFASGRTASAIAIFATVVSFATILRNGLYAHEFRIGSTAGILAFCALSLACLRKDANIRLLVMLGVTSLIPWAATLGSSNPVRMQLAFFSGLSIFIALVASTITARTNMIVASAASFIALYLTASGIELGLARPYRLATSVALQVVPTQVGWGSEVKLDSRTSEFIARLREEAGQAGFCQGGAAIDLSGALPGAVFVIGGVMPVFPSLLAGYSFSISWAREYLKRVGPQRLAQSWLIVSEASGAITVKELESLGVDFGAYRLVSDLRHPIDGTSVKLYAPLAKQPEC